MLNFIKNRIYNLNTSLILASASVFCVKFAAAAGSSGSWDDSSGGSQTIDFPNPLGVSNVADLIDRIVNYIIVIGGSIVALMVLIGAFKILTFNGDEKKIKSGKDTIVYAVVGYALVLISKGIVMIIKEVLNAQ